MQQLESRINLLVDTIKNDTTMPKTMVSMSVTADANATEPVKITYFATNTTGLGKNKTMEITSLNQTRS